ncbi:MAG: arsenite methyltransferase [bacterium]|nr:MAG: arsenite methyltransferase [bacterium]
MTTERTEKIRERVRESYGRIARDEARGCYQEPLSSCCGESGFTPERASASMGYSADDMTSVPEGSNLGLGCGNPVALASLKEGETVVDLGSGGGFDCFLAAEQVGDTGKVIGVDMTPDMISLARENKRKSGRENVEFRLGEIEHLPVADGVADIVISNCVINLSPDKPAVYREAYRVLKPGGRLSISDIVSTKPLPAGMQEDLALVSACVGGAATTEDTEKTLKDAGFVDIRIITKEESREVISSLAPDTADEAWEYFVSADIEAIKPERF